MSYQARPYILAEASWKTVKATPYEVAILPWGATEAHNYHLPYATDNLQCDHVAAEAARKAWEREAKVVALPTVPFGVNTGQFDIKLDVNMYPSTQAAVLTDVAEALSRQGISKLVVMNGHGGNNFKQMIREVGAKRSDVFICTLNWFEAVDWHEYFDEPGDHAGEMETSTIMHIAPHLVRSLEEAGSGEERSFKIGGLREGWVWAERQWSEITKDTGVGDPSRATAEKGERYLEAITDEIAEFLVELASADTDDLYEE